MAREPFVWGQGGAQLTPRQLEERRKVALALMAKGADFSPAGSGWEAAGRAFNGWWGGKQAGQFNRMEEEDTAATRAEYERVFGGRGGSPVASALAGGGASVPPGGHSPGDGHDHSDVSAADWLKYTNQGAVRNKPIAASLVDAMSFLPEMGISMEVYSGGQDAEGPNRTGSTRHDHGNAADVMFYDATGRMLDWNNPDDVATLQTIVSTAKSRGVTGFGAGDDYMGAGRMHIGFGNPGVWGAGGKGANAPAWLTEAYSGAVGSPSVSTGPSSNDLYAMMANPRMMEMYGPSIQAALGSAQQRENAIFEYNLAMQDPMRALELERARLELEAMRNPGRKPPIEINGQLVDPDTFEVVGDYRDAVKPGWSPLSAEDSAAFGLDPQKQWQVSPEGKIEQIGGGGVNVNIPGQPNIGSIPAGYVAVQDPLTMEWSMKPISGGPAEQELAAADEQAGLAAENAATATSVVTSAAQRAREAAKKRSVGGILGQVASINPQSENAELYRQVDVLKSNAKVENLNAMRAASPTGGALGSVTEKEADMLAAKSGALDPASKYFDRDLADYELTLLRTIHGNVEGSKIFDQMYPGGIAGITGGSTGGVPGGEMTDDDLLRMYGE